MKKSILIGALAVMMLFAFTACEQQIPTYKNVSYITVEQTGDFVVGQVFDASKFGVTVHFTDGSSSVIENASIEPESWKTSSATVKATLVSANEQYQASTDVVFQRDITYLNVDGTSFDIDVENAKTNAEAAIAAAEQQFINDVTGGEATVTVGYASGSEVLSIEDLRNWLDGKVEISWGLANEDDAEAIAEAVADGTELSNIGLVVTLELPTKTDLDTTIAKNIPTTLVANLVLKTPATGAVITSVTVTQAENNEVFAINDTLADVEYVVTATYTNPDETTVKVVLDASQYTFEYTTYETRYAFNVQSPVTTFPYKVTIGEDEYTGNLSVTLKADYPTAVTVGYVDQDNSTEGVQAKTYAPGAKISESDFTYTPTAWASGYNYSTTSTGTQAPSFTYDSVTVTPDQVKYATADTTSYPVSFALTKAKENVQTTIFGGVSTVTVKSGN